MDKGLLDGDDVEVFGQVDEVIVLTTSAKSSRVPRRYSKAHLATQLQQGLDSHISTHIHRSGKNNPHTK